DASRPNCSTADDGAPASNWPTPCSSTSRCSTCRPLPSVGGRHVSRFVEVGDWVCDDVASGLVHLRA
ncbi:EspF repeat-containing protein, partial [Kibdelosporangium lantanae]